MDFEIIKTEIRKYKLSSLIYNVLEILNVIELDTVRIYPFWKFLVLLKWSYLHTNDSCLKKNIQSKDLNFLLNVVEKFETEYYGLSFKNSKEVAKTFKIFAYQQFSHQQEFYNSIVDRQIVLYINLKSRFNVSEEFANKTGIKLISFFKYCYLTYLVLHSDTLSKGNIKYKNSLSQEYLTYFISKFGESELTKFLSLLTIKGPSDFEKLHKLNDERLQLYETNFFITKPFIFFRNEYRLPHRSIFNQTIKHFVYYYLKENSERFCEDFGNRLEMYIELGLKEVSKVYLTESQLKSRYKLNMVTDFLLEENILLECKATILHPRSGVLRTPEILATDLKTSIVKGYSQLLSTAYSIDKTKEWFGIIITYEEMYMGFGPDAWEEFLKDPIESFIKDHSFDLSILPPGNLFFIDIEYWDYLVQVIKESNCTIKEILLKAKELNQTTNQIEKVFMMEQVLKKHFKIDTINLSYLSDAHKTLDILLN